MTEITIYNVQRTVTANVGKQELWFLCFTFRQMVVNISVKFGDDISHIINIPCGLEYMTEITNYTVQRVITPKDGGHIYSSLFLHVVS